MARESKRPRDRYGVVGRRVWNDDVFLSWSAPQANAQTLWLYLLTAPEAGSLPGIFRFSIPATAERFGWAVEDTRRCLDEIIASKRADYDTEAKLIYIPNALGWNAPESPNVVISWRRQWSELPECRLRARAARAFSRFLGDQSKALAEAFAVVQRRDLGQSGLGQSSGRDAPELAQRSVRVASEIAQSRGRVSVDASRQNANGGCFSDGSGKPSPESSPYPSPKDPGILPRSSISISNRIPPKPPQGGAPASPGSETAPADPPESKASRPIPKIRRPVY